MSGILLGIIIAAIIVALLFLIVLSLRQPQANRVKMDKFSLEGLTYTAGLGRVIDSILPAAEEREYRKNERLIGDAGYNFSMRVLYLFKLFLPIILLIIFLSIYFINKSVYIDAIITGRIEKTVNVMNQQSNVNESAQTNDEKRNAEQARRDTFDVVNHLIDSQILRTKDAIEVKEMIIEILLDNEMATEDDAASKAAELYDTFNRVEEEKKIEPLTMLMIFFASIIGFFIPNVYLEVTKMVRYQSFDNEIIALEMLTILVGSIEGVTVKEILRILALNSKAFKKNFEKALIEYPIDFEQALINLGDSSKNKDFQALISTLRQCATSDKYAALQTLQRRRISRKEYRKLMEEKKIESKMYIAFVLFLPVLFFLAKLLLSPWQDLMSSSGLL